jgi:hypothetical protein
MLTLPFVTSGGGLLKAQLSSLLYWDGWAKLALHRALEQAQFVLGFAFAFGNEKWPPFMMQMQTANSPYIVFPH